MRLPHRLAAVCLSHRQLVKRRAGDPLHLVGARGAKPGVHLALPIILARVHVLPAEPTRDAALIVGILIPRHRSGRIDMPKGGVDGVPALAHRRAERSPPDAFGSGDGHGQRLRIDQGRP